MNNRPIIAVTLDYTEFPIYTLWQDMFRGIVDAGGVPLAIDCRSPVDDIGELVRRVDGLMLSGGGDVNPALYGGATDDPLLMRANPDRDGNELAAFAVARECRIPVLAICRGAQLVNVGLGGTLYADIVRDTSTTLTHQRSASELAGTLHAVDVHPGTRTAAWLGADGVVQVNSQHHQGINRLAAAAVVTARADDGLVEAFELPDEPIVGVQWHPEVLWPYDENARNLIHGFVGSAVPASGRVVGGAV